jgi:hypothetical protein
MDDGDENEDAYSMTRSAIREEREGAAATAREAAAALVEMIKMSDVLMALGELNAEERRIVRALLPWLANRIRKL